MSRSHHVLFVLIVMIGFVSSEAYGQACGTGVTQFSGTNSQMGRVFRDAIPAACPGKAYPGIFNPGTPYFFETYTWTNTSGSTSCVVVDFDPTVGATPCINSGNNAHASAYLNSYDPNNQALNFLGDIGSSIKDSFSIDVPAAQSLLVVVTNTASEQICNYSVHVRNIACTPSDADLSITKTASEKGPSIGANVVFTLTATNNGPDDEPAAVVTDTLPAGLTYVSNDCSASFAAPTLTWNIGALANGASATCHMTATVNTAGLITNTASISGSLNDAVPGNSTASAALTPVVPTFSPVGLAALFLALAALSFWMLRTRA